MNARIRLEEFQGPYPWELQLTTPEAHARNVDAESAQYRAGARPTTPKPKPKPATDPGSIWALP